MSASTLEVPPQRPSSQLWQKYHSSSDNSSVEDELVKEHLPLVKSVVGKLAMTLPTHVNQEDLYSAGLVGLLSAIRNYDPTSGASFGSYARLRIRGSIIDELRSLDWVPRSVHAKARKVRTAIEKVEQVVGRVPTEREVATELGLQIGEYRTLLDQVRPTTFVSIDAVNTHDDNNTKLGDAIPDERVKGPDDSAHRSELVELVHAQLEELPEMQRKVLALYYFEDLRLREIAEVFGVTESRICQIHSQAILSIRNYVQRNDLGHP
jgi:RNA polymerase sigma factor for flagellar operon FliA